MLPTSKDELIELCKRNLGAPVLRINIDDDQCDDRIDEAIKYFQTYHYEATETTYLVHQITEEEFNNKRIMVDPAILSITNIAHMGSGSDSLAKSWMSNLGQSYRNMKWDISFGGGMGGCGGTGMGITDYQLAMQHLQRIDNVFGSKYTNFEFKYHSHFLNIFTDWNTAFYIGDYIVLNCRRILDPEIHNEVYSNQWLIEYATALLGRQWGINLSKFEGVELPGGITLDGDKIYNRHDEKYTELRQEMIDRWELPVSFRVG